MRARVSPTTCVSENLKRSYFYTQLSLPDSYTAGLKASSILSRESRAIQLKTVRGKAYRVDVIGQYCKEQDQEKARQQSQHGCQLASAASAKNSFGFRSLLLVVEVMGYCAILALKEEMCGGFGYILHFYRP